MITARPKHSVRHVTLKSLAVFRSRGLVVHVLFYRQVFLLF